MEVEGTSRRPQQVVGEARDSSSNSRKRARLLPVLQDLEDETEEELVSEAYNDVQYIEEELELEQEEEEDEEEQSESESEHEYSDGSDGGDIAEDQHNEQQSQQDGVGEDQPPQPQVVVVVDNNDDECTVIQGSTTPPVPPPSSSSCLESSVVRDVTVDSSALDCGICFLPLKPPIFQCNVGHVVCSPCHDKLGVPSSCHVCSARTPGGYHRCHAMEQLVGSIGVPCPHAGHGCTDRPVYHNREGHAQVCPHMPCRCPGQACGFVGSMAALLRHFAAVHRWPCTTEDEAAVGFDIELRDGFNFITAVRAATDQVTTNQHLFLLNMERAPFGRTITAFCIHPFHTSTAMLKLTYECYRSFDTCSTHHQSSEFKVACTDLSNGLPDPSECFLFIVPRSACRDDEEFTKVNVVITQAPSQ